MAAWPDTKAILKVRAASVKFEDWHSKFGSWTQFGEKSQPIRGIGPKNGRLGGDGFPVLQMWAGDNTWEELFSVAGQLSSGTKPCKALLIQDIHDRDQNLGKKKKKKKGAQVKRIDLSTSLAKAAQASHSPTTLV